METTLPSILISRSAHETPRALVVLRRTTTRPCACLVDLRLCVLAHRLPLLLSYADLKFTIRHQADSGRHRLVPFVVFAQRIGNKEQSHVKNHGASRATN